MQQPIFWNDSVEESKTNVAVRMEMASDWVKQKERLIDEDTIASELGYKSGSTILQLTASQDINRRNNRDMSGNTILIGGGSGTKVVLNTVLGYNLIREELLPVKVIVDSTDNGGSTGSIQKDLYEKWNISMPAFGDKMAVFASTLPDWKQDILEYRFKDETRALEGLVGIEKSVRDVYANTDSREEINPFINIIRKRLSIFDARLIDSDTITLPGKWISVKNM